MPNDINHLDVHDEGLKAIFGDRFHDETTEKPEAAKTTTKQNPAKAVKVPAIEPKTEPASHKDAKWNPVKPDPNWLDKLKACAKWTALFGGLCVLLFYWQQTGRLETTTSWYALLVCVGMVFFSIGKNFAAGGDR